MTTGSVDHRAVAVSIISHGHGAMVERLVSRLLEFPEVGWIGVTCNIPERLALPEDARILPLLNAAPAGFAANQNRAFRACPCPYFCPVNPDIQLPANPFPALLAAMRMTDAAIAAPGVHNSSGDPEDSIRSFPTIRALCAKALGIADGRYVLDNQAAFFYPDWVAGMFMLFRCPSFAQLGGFDSRFFLYYEDVDICVRAWNKGMKVLACPGVIVVHDAQRASHRHPGHFRWHLASMIRFFCKHWGRLPRVQHQG